MVKMKQGMKIFTGNANPGLAKEICDRMNIPLGNAVVSRFSDGEINVQIMDNVRGCDVSWCSRQRARSTSTSWNCSS